MPGSRRVELRAPSFITLQTSTQPAFKSVPLGRRTLVRVDQCAVQPQFPRAGITVARADTSQHCGGRLAVIRHDVGGLYSFRALAIDDDFEGLHGGAIRRES